MTRIAKFLLPVCVLAASVSAQPPLIDRELFFGDPEIAGAQISPDGKHIAFLKPWNKTRNIWVKRTEEPFGAARLLTSDTQRPIPSYFWSRDAKYILFVQDQAGDENFNVYAVDPAARPRAGSAAPPARNLTEAKGVRALIYAVPKSEPDFIWVGLNDRDKAWHDLYKVRISTGERTLVRKNTDRITRWVFDLKDQLRLATRSAENGDTEILRVDAGGFAKVYSCDVFETCVPLHFHKDNRRFHLMTNKGADVDLIRLSLCEPATGQTELVESDPLKRVDFGGALFSEVTDELVATYYVDERLRIHFRDKTLEADYKWLTSQLPGKEVSLGSHTDDERLWLIPVNSDREPGEAYLFDRKTRKLTLQYKIHERLPREHLAPMQAIRYKSSDGLETPAYLSLPVGVPAKNLPLMMVPHGGPWARDLWGYDAFAQFLANRGYAVLQPNFRGSTGYGKKFLNAGNKEWGQKMQDDITWGVKHLVAQGIADPKRVGIMGGSYGGYATLAGVAFTPDVYAAAVSIVGPSNLITLLESVPPYWESIRKVFYERMGDPRTPEGKAQLERQSPLNSAGRIKTPLLVAQGANDPRVNKAESDQIVIALRDRGFPVEYLVAPDEGHGFARPVNTMAMFAAAEKFLTKHLRGRCQEGGTPEVTQRVKEITVDPKTVVLTKKIEAATVGVPKPVRDLQPATFKYQVKLQMRDSPMNLSLSTTITEEGGAWKATDRMQMPSGEVTDTVVVEKGSLIVRQRSVKQARAAIDLRFTDNKVTGSMNIGGQDRAISIDLGGPVFAAGAAAMQTIACLPLAEGYSATYRSFDVQKQKVKLMQLKVTGSESVKVPAGTFDAFRVEISSAEGGPDKATMWIAKDSRRPVKYWRVMTEAAGGALTAELTE